MAEGFSYETKLVDGMTAVAQQETAALGKLSSSVGGLDAQLSKLGRAHHEAGVHAKEHAGFMSEFRGELIPQVAAAELAAEAIKKLGEALFEGAEFAVEAAEFKENMIDAYSAVYGTAEEGEKAFAEIDSLSRAVHMPAEKAHGLAQELMLQGMENLQQVESTVAAVSALQRVGLEQGATKLQSVIERSLSTGAFVVPKKGLAGTGIQLPDLYADLAARTGHSVEQVKAELKEGKIAAEVGIAAMTDTINRGKIGEIAAKKFTFEDAVTDFKNSLRSMFQDVDVSPLTNALRDFVGIFDTGTASGKVMKATITDVFNTLIDWVAKGIEGFTLMVLHLEVAGLEMELALAPLIKGLMKVSEWIDKIVGDVGGMPAAFNAVGSLFEAPAQFLQAGQDISKGLYEGIKSGQPQIVDASDENAMYALQRTQETLGIQSPSKEMMKLGRHTSEGFAMGLEQGGDGGLDQMLELPSFSPGQSGGKSVTVTVDMGGLSFHGIEHHEDIRALVEEAAADAFERAALEIGG